ncbi:eL32 family ribosomal protein [Nanoarchaeota archaeon]
MAKFLRRTSERYSKLGKRRKKKQTWRRPTGRDNKMREKRRGYPDIVGVGHKKKKDSREKIKGKTPVLIKNPYDLGKLKENQIAILSRVGLKNKILIAKKAKENKIQIYNLNTKQFLREVERVEKLKEKEKKAKADTKEKKKKEKKK